MSVDAESELIRAVACDINLGKSVLDAYMLPSGEKRLSPEGLALALGYTERWFYNRTKRKSKWLEGLRATGFIGAQQELRIIRQFDGKSARGASLAKTISIRDSVKLIAYEAIIGRNINAIVLLAALAEVGLEKVLEEAFAGRSIEFLLEKIVHYTQWTYEELEEVLQYNREELAALYPWRDSDLSGRKNPNA